MSDSRSFSESVDALLHHLRPHGRPRSCFPDGLDPNQTRQRLDESLQVRFVRLVDTFCHGEPQGCAIERNIALFVSLFWQGSTTLTGANICTLVATCDLDEYYLAEPADCEAVYLRLDLDYSTLGEPFSHPLPHIHLQGGLSPRFALDGGNSGNVVMDYLEFLYRQFVPSKWTAWMQRQWDEDFALTGGAEEENPFPMIVRAFAEGQVAVLRQYATQLTRLKRLLRRRKDDLFGFCMDSSHREMVEYPEAR